MFLLQRRLGATKSGGLLAQALMDRMSDDLDHSIREMGVGDLSVGKNVKNLFKMVNQRFHLYEDSLAKTEEMVIALGIVFSVGDQTQKSVEINLLNMYLASFTRKLNEYSDADIVTASFSFPIFQRSDLAKNG
jgi:cytochrome b pre-mRNA-processing protein 3